MAFAFECKRCGYQQAAHDFPDDYPNVCRSYISPNAKAEAELWEENNRQLQDIERRRRLANGIPDNL